MVRKEHKGISEILLMFCELVWVIDMIILWKISQAVHYW